MPESIDLEMSLQVGLYTLNTPSHSHTHPLMSESIDLETSLQVELHHVMSYHVVSCHIMSCHVTSCRVMSHHVVSCHIMSHHVMSCHVTSCRVMSCRVMSHRVMSCHIMSCRHVIHTRNTTPVLYSNTPTLILTRCYTLPFQRTFSMYCYVPDINWYCCYCRCCYCL